MNEWRRVLSKEAARLWEYLQACKVSTTTLGDLAQGIRASKYKTRLALLELEERGFLYIYAREVE